MDNMNRWYNHYIKNIALEKIEWIKLNSTELYMFFKNNYLDKEVWKYVYDEKANTIYPTPLGMNYLNFDNPINNKNYSFLLGIVENNIGKKTIVAATIYLDKCFMFTNHGIPVTYISTMEVNSYFRNKGIYKKMCEALINFINLNQHIVTTEQTDMGAKCNVFNILKNTLLSNGFHNCILEDNHNMIIIANKNRIKHNYKKYDIIINSGVDFMQINKELKKYIEENIFPSYRKNDLGHNLEHIKYVVNRSLRFANEVDDINYDMVYTIAAYHDIGHYIDAKNHEKVSAEMLLADENLKKFFTEKEIKIMSEAVYDHRASLEGEPRSIYGKIVSSADRNTLIDVPLKRTYAYRLEHNPNDTIDEIIEESRQHIINKFGKKGYATEKMYFEDLDYKKFLEEISTFAENKEEFRKRFMEVNELNNKLKLNFDEIKRHNPNMSLDEVLYAVYDKVKDEYNKPFDVLRNMILEANGINELEYYTKNVRQDLKDYIAEHIFPEYDKNDGGHNIAHILEVIRRSFALNDTFKLGLDDNMMYAIASCHDWGKYEDHATHHLIAARNFMNDEGMKKFFTEEERKTIKEAIEDHRSSKEDEPRSVYGKLISSADRNTRIEIVFIRSFFVAHERMPETNIEEYLDYTIQRLSKKYDEENPENMFFEDETYKIFIQDMRDLLKKEDEFKNRYCEVNHITSREHRVQDEQGEIAYTKVLRKK